VGERRTIVRRFLLAVGASAVALMGAVAIYIFVNLDEARALETTAQAARHCRRALSSSSDATCANVLAEKPRDPWGRLYRCEMSSPRHAKIVSLGRDGRPGGSGVDADAVCAPSMLDGKESCACD
jgi:hypothetical protein